MRDIDDIEDIKVFVNQFYIAVRADELLAPVFALRISAGDWDRHLQKMYGFWNTVLFFEKGYKGNPFIKHLGLPISQEHFDRWVLLFDEVIDTHFAGPKANETKRRASKMATMVLSKMEYFESRGVKPIM